MPTSRSDRRLSLGRWALVGVVTLLTLQVSPGSAQTREVAGKEIALAEHEAAIRLDFADGSDLSVALLDGTVWLDGEQVGVYENEDDLYAAWHELLWGAVSLDDGPLARALIGWNPPSDLGDESRRLAERIHEALQESLSSVEEATQDLDLAARALQEKLLREEIQREFEEEYGRQERGERTESNGWVLNALESIGGGLGGLVRNAVNLLILGLLGFVAVFFAGSNLESVAVTARRSPMRAGAVGIAGAFLACPIWILGIAALSVSLIGIPVLLVWVPLFPVAMVVAASFGLFAMASNLGEWMSKKRYPYLRWIRSSNPYTLVVGGLVGLTIPFMLANTVEIAGSMFGFLEGLLTLFAWMTCSAFVLIGFGAVILTRAGRRPEFYQGDTLDDAFLDLDETPSDGADWFGAERGSGLDPAGEPAASGDDRAPDRSSDKPSQEGGSG